VRESSRFIQVPVAIAGVLLFVLGWWWTARGLPDYVLPGPGAALAATLQIFGDPELLRHAAVSLVRVVMSVAAAMAIAIALGALVARYPIFSDIVERRIFVFLNSFPSVGWAVLGVLWFQISTATVVFVQIAIILPFCIVNALAGFRQIDPDMAELGRSLTRRPVRRFLLLTLPLLAPFLMAGLRVAYGICWKIALVSELFGARSGMGYLLMQAQLIADAPMVFGACIAIVVIYVATDWAILRPLVNRTSSNRWDARQTA
jgi:ABC-type nitrate/sulfonate/bicarbonate transport system permease component